MAREIQEFQAKVTADTKGAAKDIDEVAKKGEKFDGTVFSAEADVENAKALSSLDQIEQDAKALQAKVTADKIEPQVDTTKAKQGIDDVGKSADSSKSALANMVGNSAQDLGELGGVAGSAGVAIGQMAEYMADAAAEGEGLGSVLSSFGKVAGPIAALSAGTALLSAFITDLGKFSQDTEKAISDLAKAIHEADGNARAALQKKAMTDWLKDIPATGQSTIDALDKLKLTFTDVADAVEGKVSPAVQKNLDLLDGWNQQVAGFTDRTDTGKAFEDYAKSVGMSRDELEKTLPAAAILKDEISGETTVVKGAIEQNDKYNRVLGDTTTAQEDSATAIAASQKATEALAKADAEAAQRADEHRQALADLDDQLNSTVLSTAAVQSAQIKANQALRDYDKAMKDGSKSQEDHNLALNDMFTNLVNVAKQTGDTTAAQSGLTQETDKAVLSSKTQIQYLEAVAETLGPNDPLRQLLANYIAELSKIPTQISTEVDADTEKALAKLRAIQAYITSISGGVDIPIGFPGASGMAGTPYHPGGPITVGEAGRETVWLPQGARVDTAGRTMQRDLASQPSVVNNYTINVTVPLGSPTAQVGRYVADALDAHERRSGSRRKVA